MLKYFETNYLQSRLDFLIKVFIGLFSDRVLNVNLGEKSKYSSLRWVDDLKSDEGLVLDSCLLNNNEIIFADGIFSGVVCLDLPQSDLEHGLLIKEIKRVMKVGGVAILFYPQGLVNNKKRLTKAELKEILEEQFSLCNITHVGNGCVLIWEIMRSKILKIKFSFIRKVFSLITHTYLYLIRLLSLDKHIDMFYTGLFVIVKK